MYIRELFEAQGGKREPLLAKLDRYRKDDDVFVTFTSILKLGINPSTEYTDPIAIYAYPVPQIIDDLEQVIIPFAGDRRYAYIFRSTGLSAELQSYDEYDLGADIQRMEKRFRESILKPDPDYRVSNPKAYWDHALTSWFDRFGGEPGKALWEISERIARHIERREPGRDFRMIWNSLLRSCNYDSVIDRGEGIISENEPAQGCFLSIEGITPIEAAVNDLVKTRP